MTNDKIGSRAKTSMLDDFLDDTDKALPPVPRYTPPAYTGGSYYRNNDTPSLFDDEGPDPLDDGYGGYRRAAPAAQPKSAIATMASGKLREAAAVLRGSPSIQGKVYLMPEDGAFVANALQRVLAEAMDQLGLCWSSAACGTMREALREMVWNSFYNGMAVIKDTSMIEDDDPNVDPVTGEVKF